MNLDNFNPKPKVSLNHKLDGFKLISLEVINHPVLGTNFFNFIDDNDTSMSIYSTVIIGVNGTGKSYLFRFILELLRCLYFLAKGEDKYITDNRFELVYSRDKDLFVFTNKNSGKILTKKVKRKSFLWKNGDRVSFNTESPDTGLPPTIVANSIMLTDKFLVPRNKKEAEAFPLYNYLGVRNRPQSASTRSYVRKTIEFLVRGIQSSTFKQRLKDITNFLGFTPSIKVTYQTRYTKLFFTGSLKKEDIDTYFLEIKNKYEGTGKIPPYKLHHYLALKDLIVDNKHYLDIICDFTNKLVSEGKLKSKYRSTVKLLEYDIVADEELKNLKYSFTMLEELRVLGIMSFPEISLRDQNDFNLQHSSSGEYHFFSSMIGLMASVTPHSLIFIDEPEISLHPNWQMQYLSFLRQLFSDPVYKTCHVLIATHSHFLISDLQGGSSKIIGLKKQNGIITTKDIQGVNTFGWSAEEVLLDIFDLPTTRNHYVAERIGEILDLIAQPNKNVSLIKEKVDELIGRNILSLSKEDPLKEIIDKLVEKYG